MQGNITVELDDSAMKLLPKMARCEITKRIASEWCKTDQYKKILAQIKIDDNDIAELKKRIMDDMAWRIIQNWKENGNDI